MIYTPTVMKIKKLLEKPIVDFLKERYNKTSKEKPIHEHIKKLKDEDPEKFKLITFIYAHYYSEQVGMVLTELVRGCIIKDTDDGYKLTSYGESYEWLNIRSNKD